MNALASGCNWLDERAQAFDAAVATLKARCILVQVTNRDSPIHTYRVSGRHGSWLAEDVIELANRLEEEEPKKRERAFLKSQRTSVQNALQSKGFKA